MGARADAVEAELAFRVRHHAGAVFHKQPHARDAGLARALDAVAVAVSEHGADDESFFAEHAAQHPHPRSSGVGAESRRAGAGAVDAVPLQSVEAQLRAIREGHGCPGRHGADWPHQRRPGATGWIGDSAGTCRRCGQARSACNIFKAGRQHVSQTGGRCASRRAVEHTHRVINKVAQFSRGFADRLADQEVGACRADPVQRQVIVHHVGVARRHEVTQEIRLADGQYRRHVDAVCNLVWPTAAQASGVNAIENAGTGAPRADRRLRRHQTLRDGKWQVTGRRRHSDLESAAAARQALTEVGAGRRDDILIKPVRPNRLAERPGAADEMDGRIEPGRCPAGLRVHGHRHDRAGDGRTGGAVVNNAGWVQRQVLLQNRIARP